VEVVLNVAGMSCSHCEKAVKDALGALDGVEEVAVNLENGHVDVRYEETKLPLETLVEVIEEQGYDVAR